ncbi:MAG: exodeoxyribonuclease VII large subunit [Tannerellaceae bacterium]|jgi:exodeoxyribonuclease VII large subunit|nr:exodeoxyribonuclease VII large subunit [Tannerellaceae bacterium]
MDTPTARADKGEELSLSELGRRIKAALSNTFPSTYWVRAETSDVRPNASGHCYLEFVEKNDRTNQPVAKIRANIWARTFYSLKPRFENETGQRFASGLNVLVKVSVEYHELYGLSLNVIDIDPAYTVGDMARRRLEIIRRLQSEDVFTLNKELALPTLPQRIALITSPTAAGYEDFINQLADNAAGYVFYIKLFPAIMQGEKTEASVIAALERIYAHAAAFDAVVIIRGGGAASELGSFDSYNLAANCAQFPLPIITGIGHERDDTVVDLVAHTRMKTPTAVAAFLAERIDTAAQRLAALRQNVLNNATQRLLNEKNRLQRLATRLPSAVGTRLERSRAKLNHLAARLPVASSGLVNRHKNQLTALETKLRQSLRKRLSAEEHFLNLTGQFIRMASPEYILKRGYTLTLKDGKIVKRAADFHTGDPMTTRFIDGEVTSTVTPAPPVL